MQTGVLGRQVPSLQGYAPEVLQAVPRALGRAQLDLTTGAALPFVGVDVWRAYELCWRDPAGVPQLAVGSLHVPIASPNLVESKSLKLYLGGLYYRRFRTPEEVAVTVARDVGACVGEAVRVALTLQAPNGPLHAAPEGTCVDGEQPLRAPDTRPDAACLVADVGPGAEGADSTGARPQRLYSRLLRSLCPVTGQPDWADVQVELHGARLLPAAFLTYVLGFAEHTGFHEQCVERIFVDLQRALRPTALSVFARYTRRGGIDINPFRSTPGLALPDLRRTFRQ